MSAPTLPELIERIRESGGSLTIELALTEIDRRLTALEGRGACCECPDLSRSPNAALWTSPHPTPEQGAASDPVEAMREACIDVVEGMRLVRDEDMSELRERVVVEMRALEVRRG